MATAKHSRCLLGILKAYAAQHSLLGKRKPRQELEILVVPDVEELLENDLYLMVGSASIRHGMTVHRA